MAQTVDVKNRTSQFPEEVCQEQSIRAVNTILPQARTIVPASDRPWHGDLWRVFRLRLSPSFWG